MSTAAEIARRVGDAWAQYVNELLASVDARCVGPTLSEECGRFASIRELLKQAVATGDYVNVPYDAREIVLQLPTHVRDEHPEYWHLFEDDPGPATRALLDQVEAARRDAEIKFGISK